MKSALPILLLALSLSGELNAETATLTDLDWLSGCWEAVSETATQEECWLYPAGDRMIGINRTIDGKRGAFEFLRIERQDGRIVYLASPGGREPVPFALTDSGPGRAVFENPAHDFPQRLTYQRDGQRLSVRVEARRDGAWEGFGIEWTRSDWTEASNP